MKYILVFLCIFSINSCSNTVSGTTSIEEIEQVQQPALTDIQKIPSKEKEVKNELNHHFDFPIFENSQIHTEIQAWGEKVIQDTAQEYKNYENIEHPEINFSFEKYQAEKLTSIVYTVRKYITKGSPEVFTKTFYLSNDGKSLAPKDIFLLEKKSPEIKVFLYQHLEKRKNLFHTSLAHELTKYLENPKFYIDGKEVVFIFDMYEIGPRSAGIITIKDSIKNLEPLLQTKFLPEKKIEKNQKKIEKKYISHKIESGEYIKLIAQKYGKDYKKIIKYNQLENPDILEVGQKIKIPLGEEYKITEEQKKEFEEKEKNLDTFKKVEKNNTSQEKITEKKIEKKNTNATEKKKGKKIIALSFDDGPNRTSTVKLLKILNKYNIKATFFVLGRNIEFFPDILQREYKEGHEIGNHTRNHPNLKNLSEKAMKNEIEATRKKIEELTGKSPTLFRPPYGAFGEREQKAFSGTMVMWNVDSRDWKNRDSEKNIETVLSEVKDGSIILFHDIHEESVESIEPLINKLQADGYQFVTVGALLNTEQKHSYSGKVCYGAYNCK